MHILIAPNAYKNSLPADAVAEAISKGLQQSKLSVKTTNFPVGDGGDGTAKLLLQHLGGNMIMRTVHDPLGRKINASFGLTDDLETAIIELADASGLKLLKQAEYDPLHATTFGTGELIMHALDKKVKKIILCIGGSATVDGGAGVMAALGMKFYDEKQKEIDQFPALLTNLSYMDGSGLDKRLSGTELIVLCDVENSLLGEHGAANVFGPQKGASKKEVDQLKACLAMLNKVVMNETGKDMASIKYGGAAGGVAASMQTLLGAGLFKGIDYFLDITGFNEVLQTADLVITGEGSIDAQTLQGKAPFGVAARAKQFGKQVLGIAGKVPLKDDHKLREYFDVLIPVNNEVTDISEAIKNTYVNLERTGFMLGNLLVM